MAEVTDPLVWSSHMSERRYPSPATYIPIPATTGCAAKEHGHSNVGLLGGFRPVPSHERDVAPPSSLQAARAAIMPILMVVRSSVPFPQRLRESPKPGDTPRRHGHSWSVAFGTDSGYG